LRSRRGRSWRLWCWLADRAGLEGAAVARTGLPVWAVTVAGGMLLRVVSGQGIAVLSSSSRASCWRCSCWVALIALLVQRALTRRRAA
jgi:hypothetical protein